MIDKIDVEMWAVQGEAYNEKLREPRLHKVLGWSRDDHEWAPVIFNNARGTLDRLDPNDYKWPYTLFTSLAEANRFLAEKWYMQ